LLLKSSKGLSSRRIDSASLGTGPDRSRCVE
jgi:hypothetical protein